MPDFNIGLNLGAIGYANFTQFLTLGGVTGSVLTPLFKGGELEGAFGIANAQRDEAAYIYRDVVIRAYREARDAYMSVSYLNLERNSTKKQQEAENETSEPFIEIKYHSNENNNGYECLDIKYNFLSMIL
ncbi:MAG: hypothetical protein IJ950_05640 [Helicobacter sp.]|nr:hypothetical protein [Helicobacter sp.]